MLLKKLIPIRRSITNTIIEKDDLILLKSFIKKIPNYHIDLINELKLSLRKMKVLK